MRSHYLCGRGLLLFPEPVYGGRRLRLESWRNAQEQGTHAATTSGAREPFVAVPWFWSDQYDLTLQIAGLPDERLRTIRREVGDGAFILFQLDDDERLVAASGLGRSNTVARDIRLAELLIATHEDLSLISVSEATRNRANDPRLRTY
jgi:3-phenylpropionate/trans-cinnamate dioxygenase ferredoxin reductase component